MSGSTAAVAAGEPRPMGMVYLKEAAQMGLWGRYGQVAEQASAGAESVLWASTSAKNENALPSTKG